jgi:hypothetical protein
MSTSAHSSLTAVCAASSPASLHTSGVVSLCFGRGGSRVCPDSLNVPVVLARSAAGIVRCGKDVR